jgi:hypothetical protein
MLFINHEEMYPGERTGFRGKPLVDRENFRRSFSRCRGRAWIYVQCTVPLPKSG